MVEAAAPMITLGCATLLVGSLVLFVAGQVGLRAGPSRSTSTRSVFGVVAATGAALLGSLAAFLFLAIWLHGSALEALLANTELTPKPSELARHLMGILNKSMLAFSIVGGQAVLQAVAGILAPTSGSGEMPTESEQET
jgi:cytosine/uracil/thiamine/allantoin permease